MTRMNDLSVFVDHNQTLYPLSSPQLDIWLDQVIRGDDPRYNIGGYLRIDGAIDARCFESAVNLWVRRHDALRIVLVRGAGADPMPRQAFLGQVSVSVALHDFSHC